MAFGSKELAIENARLEAKLEMMELRLADKDVELTELKIMLSRTQEALIAKEAPDAYRDQKIAEYEAANEPSPEELEAQEERRRRAETNATYLARIEGPLFLDADDMTQMLIRPSGAPTPGSLHNNEES